jgi:hypothetical protein
MFRFLKRLFMSPRRRAVENLFDAWGEIGKQWNEEEQFPANFNIPLSWFMDGTEDENLVGLVGKDDSGNPVTSFPVASTSGQIRYAFLDRTLDVLAGKTEVSAKLMVEVCCGLLVHKILPRRNELGIASDLDFRNARLARISWNQPDSVWRVHFTFDGSKQTPD